MLGLLRHPQGPRISWCEKMGVVRREVSLAVVLWVIPGSNLTLPRPTLPPPTQCLMISSAAIHLRPHGCGCVVQYRAYAANANIGGDPSGCAVSINGYLKLYQPCRFPCGTVHELARHAVGNVSPQRANSKQTTRTPSQNQTGSAGTV